MEKESGIQDRGVQEFVILVDQYDKEIGTMEKYEAHRKGLLHRAISVALKDEQGRWLLQRRAASKYHSPSLIANACCSHPRPGESIEAAAHRRLFDELRIKLSQDRLQYLGPLLYCEPVGVGLVEHEYDHLFLGVIHSSEIAVPNPDEVSELLWIFPEDIEASLGARHWAAWFPHVFRAVRRFEVQGESQ